MTKPWTDPITGAQVTGGTHTVTITLDGRSHTYISAQYVPAKYADVVARWEARDE